LQRRWNESGYNGLIPKFRGGRPSKLTSEQKEQLKEELKGKSWITEEVREFTFLKFKVGYTLKQILIFQRCLIFE